MRVLTSTQQQVVSNEEQLHQFTAIAHTIKPCFFPKLRFEPDSVDAGSLVLVGMDAGMLY